MPTIFKHRCSIKFFFINNYALDAGLGLCVMGKNLFPPKTEKVKMQELISKAL